MRTVPSALQAHLDGATTSLATLWTITRADGAVLRFTDHDRDIVFGGEAYAAAVGYQRTDIAGSATLSVDNVDVQGILNSSQIKESDLRGGRYDYAAVRIALINWKDPDGDGEVSLRRGWFGEIVYDEKSQSFSTELRGLTQLYQQTIIEQYSRQCRYDIGDARCNRANALPIFAATIAAAKTYAVGDVVKAPKVGASNPPITEDYGDTIYRCTVAGTTSASAVNNFPTVLFAAATPATALDVADSNTFSRAAGSFLDDGWQVDMVFRSAGFANGANNGAFRVAAVTATTLDVTASSLVAESGSGDESLSHIAYNNGVEFSLEGARRVAGEVIDVIDQSTIVIGPPGGPGGGRLAYPLFFKNPGFETNNGIGTYTNPAAIGDWSVTLGTVAVINSDKHSGAYCLKIPNFWNGANPAKIEQTVDVSDYAAAIDGGAKTVTVSYWYRGSSGVAGRVWIDYEFLDAADATISTTAGVHNFDIFDVWKQFSQQNTIPALTRKIVVKVNGGEGVALALVDDFTIAASFTDANFPDGEFAHGVLTFDSGLNAGLSEEVKTYDALSKTITLYLSMPYPIAIGDKVGLHIGCNREFSRCQALGNHLNYGGFLFVPGDDAFLRYPDSPY